VLKPILADARNSATSPRFVRPGSNRLVDVNAPLPLDFLAAA
jgi:hypothetical protein